MIRKSQGHLLVRASSSTDLLGDDAEHRDGTHVPSLPRLRALKATVPRASRTPTPVLGEHLARPPVALGDPFVPPRDPDETDLLELGPQSVDLG